MLKVLKKEEFEELLVANWTKFIDAKKVIAFVTENVREHAGEFQTIKDHIANKGIQISISRFTLNDIGFTIWIDFSVPYKNDVANGTCECLLTRTGILLLDNIIGNIVTG